MRLSDATRAALPADVAQPGYARTEQARGIVHLGIGAFHRAHQAVYTDDAMAAGDRDWAITGVSLRSRQVHEQLAAQDGLYTVATRDAEGERLRLIGAGTLSKRTRNSPPAFNEIRVEGDRFETLVRTMSAQPVYPISEMSAAGR